jgi:hypothetical protein
VPPPPPSTQRAAAAAAAAAEGWKPLSFFSNDHRSTRGVYNAEFQPKTFVIGLDTLFTTLFCSQNTCIQLMTARVVHVAN